MPEMTYSMPPTENVGRPTKYRPEFVKKINDYLKTTGGENQRLAKKVDVALLLGVNDETLDEWARKRDDNGQLMYPEFSDALTRVTQAQHQQLLDIGIFGGKEINANIVGLVLAANHGYVKTEKNVIAGDKDEPLKIEITEARHGEDE